MKSRTRRCSAAELKILGDYWTLTIIQSLAAGNQRFCQLQRSVPGISPTTLSNRLKKLECQKLLHRRTETADKISIEYSLTDKGRGILPVLKEIRIFADRYL